MNTLQLIAALQRAQNLENSHQVARWLGVRPCTVYTWTGRGSQMDDATGVKVAQGLGIPPGLVLAWLAAARAGSGPVARAWASAADTLARQFGVKVKGGQCILCQISAGVRRRALRPGITWSAPRLAWGVRRARLSRAGVRPVRPGRPEYQGLGAPVVSHV